MDNKAADITRQRIANWLAKPFEPGNPAGKDLNETMLLKIKHATEYSAGQLYEIRQLLEKIAAK